MVSITGFQPVDVSSILIICFILRRRYFVGPSPSGKAEGFDPLTSLVRIQLALWIPDGYHKASVGHGTKTLRMAIADVLHRYSGFS